MYGCLTIGIIQLVNYIQQGHFTCSAQKPSTVLAGMFIALA